MLRSSRRRRRSGGEHSSARCRYACRSITGIDNVDAHRRTRYISFLLVFFSSTLFNCSHFSLARADMWFLVEFSSSFPHQSTSYTRNPRETTLERILICCWCLCAFSIARYLSQTRQTTYGSLFLDRRKDKWEMKLFECVQNDHLSVFSIIYQQIYVVVGNW